MEMAPVVWQDGEEEEEEACRICRNPGESDDPLRYPCACKGSIKFVHQDCLLNWLIYSNHLHCEVCKHPFSFSPVYAENAPSRLPFQIFIAGIVKKASRVPQFVLRLSFVLSVWLLVIPLITFWIWRWSFVRSFSEGYSLLLSHMSMIFLLTDCLFGFLLSVSILIIFLGATSLRDYFRNLREIGGQIGNGDFNGDRDDGEAREIDRAGDIINAENGAAHLEMQAAHLEARVVQIIEGLDDPDGVEDLHFDELVGMQGPVFHLVESACTVLASNMIFLGVVIFIPFTIGRIALHYSSQIFPSAIDPVLLMKRSTGFHSPLASMSMMNHALTDVANSKFDNQESNLFGQVSEMLTAKAIIPLSENIVDKESSGTSRLSDYETLAVGYLFIISSLFLCLGTVAFIRFTRGEPLSVRRFPSVSSSVEVIVSLFTQFMAAMRHLLTMVKVAILLVFELGVFPLICGWGVDICTLKMFSKSVTQRIEYLSVFPINSTIFHWGVGFLFMLQISLFVSLLRGVLHARVLYFLRDQIDPNCNIFHDLVDKPLHKHVRRVLLSLAVDGSLIVMLVFFPVKLAMRVAPSVFPLNMSVSDPYNEVSVHMLLFRIFIPFAIEHFKLRVTFTALLRCWFTEVGRLLGLADFVLPRQEDNHGNRNNGEPATHDRLQVQIGGQDRMVNPVDKSEGSNRYRLRLQIVLLLVMSGCALLVVISGMIVVPISLGRSVVNAISRLPIINHRIKINDIYAFLVGSCVIGTALAGVRCSVEHFEANRFKVLGQFWKWCGIVFKSLSLLSIWLFVIPVLIGLLFELVIIIPMRVPVNESPVFLLHHDWAFGLIILKLWTRLVMVVPGVPLVDESWHIKFRRAREDGFSGLRGFWVLREIMSPIIMKLLTALSVPYVLARGVFPVFGYPLLVNSAVYRFAWVGCLVLSTLGFFAMRFRVWITNLHNSIRDDRYLIGRRLHNFEHLQ